MDVSGLIASFATGSYTVTRRTTSTVSRGRAVAGSSSTLTITAAVYPATGDDLKRLPEGRRDHEVRAVVTATALQLGGVGSSYEADRISIDGKTYEVSHVELWRDPLSRNAGYRCIVTDVQ